MMTSSCMGREEETVGRAYAITSGKTVLVISYSLKKEKDVKKVEKEEAIEVGPTPMRWM